MAFLGLYLIGWALSTFGLTWAFRQRIPAVDADSFAMIVSLAWPLVLVAFVVSTLSAFAIWAITVVVFED